MKTVSVHFWLLLTGIVLSTACPKRVQTIPARDAAEGLARALELKRQGKYPQAEDGFTYVIFNFPGSREAADAQFHLADCYYLSRNYSQAQSEFEFYLKNFPHGTFQEEANFKLALATFHSAPGPAQDQSQLRRARELLLDFLERYPNSEFQSKAKETLTQIDERLAENDFQAARLYFKSGEYKSAMVYYEYIQQSWPDLHWSFADRYRLGVCYYHTGQQEKAKAVLTQVLGDSVPAKIHSAAQKLLNQINTR
ncbi:MAG: outer membrane protein assembly factor BamD [candidate division WOR-3 bacterium]